MAEKKLSVFYFSPNGTTSKVAEEVAKNISSSYEIHDLTPFENRWERNHLSEDETAVIALPVYGGRLPGIASEFFRGLKADGAKAVAIVSYGNNTAGEALAELKNLSQKAGFKVIAGAEVPTEHCMNKNIAHGRPDADDLKGLKNFGEKIKALLKKDDIPEIDIPGCYPYSSKVFDVRVAPVWDKDKCSGCGKCIEDCPVKAINPANPAETDVIRCLLCMKCINECPEHARTLNDEKILSNIGMIEKLARVGKKQKFIFGQDV